MQTLDDWNNGIGSSGSGKYSLFRYLKLSIKESYRTSIERHEHFVDIPKLSSTSGGTNTHGYNISAFHAMCAVNHPHIMNLSAFNSGSTGSHSHDLDITSFNSDIVSPTPEYFG